MTYHEDYLIESDRNLKVAIEDRKIYSLFKGRATNSFNVCDDSSVYSDVPAVAASPATRHETCFKDSADRKKRKQITKAFVKVIAHGPDIISFLSNPAVQELLIELGLVDTLFKFPERWAIEKKLKEFENADNKIACNEMLEKFKLFSIQ